MVNVKPVKLGNTERMSFGKIDEVIDMPNLIDIQKASYKWLLDEGAERVIVSQLVRSPGVYYKMDHDKTGKELYSTTVIPNRGAWLEYETDVNDVFYVRIDKNRKLPVTSFIRALGLGSDAEILDYFGDDERMRATIEKDAASNVEEGLIEVYKKLRPSEPPTASAYAIRGLGEINANHGKSPKRQSSASPVY